MNSPYKHCPDDTDTVASLAIQLEETTGKLEMLLCFVDEHLDACACENCGHINLRRHMLAVYGLDRGSDGKALPKSSRWFCGYCVHAACMRGGNGQECRKRIAEWFVLGYGRQFLREMDSHFAHLGVGAKTAPVADQLRREFAPEILEAARKLR